MAKKRRPKKSRPSESSPVPASDRPTWRSAGWQPDFDAASLLDYVADAVLEHMRDAITTQRRVEGGVQKPLSRTGLSGRNAIKGRRPDVRAWTGRKMNFPGKLRRGKMRVKGLARLSGPRQNGKAAPTAGSPTSASLKIRPNAKHRGFAALEARRGVTYFADDGDVLDAVNKAIQVWTKAAIGGTPPEPDSAEKDADEV